MPARPVVRDHILTYYAAAGTLHAIPLETPDWFRWLETRISFSYDHPWGWFTARREVRYQYVYWRVGQPTAPVVKLPKPSRSAQLYRVKKHPRYYWYGYRHTHCQGIIKVYIGAQPDQARLDLAAQRGQQKLIERGAQL